MDVIARPIKNVQCESSAPTTQFRSTNPWKPQWTSFIPLPTQPLMVKPSQASEDQLNSWIASLSGDILTTTGKTGGGILNKKQQQQQHSTRKRTPKDESSKRDGEWKRGRKRGREYLGDGVTGQTDNQQALNVSEDQHHGGIAAETVAELRILEMTLKNTLDRTTEKAHRAPYDPGKAPSASVSKRKLNLQPRRSDYGGIGLARESVYIALNENGWRKKLCKKFIEHIPGFFGKQRTKAMKKQTSGDMLWRQRLAMKQQRDLQQSNDEE